MRHAVGISRQINICGDKAEQVKYRGTRPLQFPSPIPSLSPYTHLSLSLSRVGSDQAAGKWAGGVRYEKRERLRSIYTSHTHRQASLMVSLYTTLVPPEAVHWASP